MVSFEQQQRYIQDFCRLILKYDENLLIQGEHLTSSDKAFLYENAPYFQELRIGNEDIRKIVQKEHVDYCKNWKPEDVPPYNFLFYLPDYEKAIKNYWKEICPGVNFPRQFDKVFEFVKEYGNEFSITKSYVDGYMRQNVAERVNKQIEKSNKSIVAANQQIQLSQEAMAHAETVAKRSIKKATESAKNEAMQIARKVMKNAIQQSEVQATKKMTEASVTVLGIFSGIILTLAGVFSFSAAALENLNTANFYRFLAMILVISMLFAAIFLGLFYFLYNVRHALNQETKSKKRINDNRKNLLLPIISVEVLFGVLFLSIIFFHGDKLIQADTSVETTEETTICSNPPVTTEETNIVSESQIFFVETTIIE